MNPTLEHWREAAALIVAARSEEGTIKEDDKSNRRSDYEVLLLKRSQRNDYMPNALVFPGGAVDASDFSNDWMKVFGRQVQTPTFGLGVVRQPPGTRSPMFVTDRTQFGSLIPGEVGFRICAIRETFEESGILLVVPEDFSFDAKQNFENAYEHDGDKLTKWREEVQNNPLKFIEMCRELRCVPNIWALHEWGNWLTPVMYNKGRRFDTAFYICCLPKKPTTADDQKEVTSLKWWTPRAAIDGYVSEQAWIAPPQIYDLCRLCNFTSIQELHGFSAARALEGCERWVAVLLYAEDGVAYLLQGDERYPEEPDITGKSQAFYFSNESIKSLARDKGRFHRVLICNSRQEVYMNIPPKFKHVAPLGIPISYSAEPMSKL